MFIARTPCAYQQTIPIDLVQSPMARSNNRISGATATFERFKRLLPNMLRHHSAFTSWPSFPPSSPSSPSSSPWGQGQQLRPSSSPSQVVSGQQECLKARRYQLGWEL